MLPGLESPTHILLILVVVLLLFGAKRLPEFGRSLGRGINEFKEGLNSKGETEEKKRTKVVEGKWAEAEPVDKYEHNKERATHAKSPSSPS